jgi:tetratricopeptide (TPR) repeat protein
MTLRLETPAALALLGRANAARKLGHFDEALGLLSDAIRLAPRSALLERKRCEALAEAGKRPEALKSCEHAFELGARSAHDTWTMVNVRVAGKVPPSPLDAYQAHDFAETAIRFDSALPWGYAGMGQLAYRIGDDELLARSTWQLQKLAPDHPETKALERLSALAGHSGWVSVARWAALLVVLGTLVHWLATRSARVLASGPSAGGHVLTP